LIGLRDVGTPLGRTFASRLSIGRFAMRNVPFLVGFLLVIGGVLLLAPYGRAGDVDPRDQEIARLKEENAKLKEQLLDLALDLKLREAKVAQLKQQLARREPVLKDLKLDLTPAPTRPGAAPASPKTPGNWVPREINGMTYYLVPCGQEVRGVGQLLIKTGTMASPSPARR
jgi:hypothetical protein